MTPTVLALADLGLLVMAAVFGLTSLVIWGRHRAGGFPVAKITVHVTLQVVSIGVWAGFAFTGTLPLAWIAFAVITVGQVFGDLLMFASYRARHPGEPRPSYLAAGGEVVSFRRPAAALHALTAAAAWFGMLAICIVATIAA